MHHINLSPSSSSSAPRSTSTSASRWFATLAMMVLSVYHTLQLQRHAMTVTPLLSTTDTVTHSASREQQFLWDMKHRNNTAYDLPYLNANQFPVLQQQHRRRRRTLLPSHVFPDINIIGLPKTGTSQLYNVLDAHVHVARFGRAKEHCIPHVHVPQRVHYHDEAAFLRNLSTAQVAQLRRNLQTDLARHHAQHQHNQTTINGCLVYPLVFLHYHYVHQPKHAKFIVMLRDPADWLYATWCFWRDPFLDPAPSVQFDWADANTHYRSPALFHKLILAQQQQTPSSTLFWHYRDETVTVPRTILQLVGRNQVLFLRNEDLRHYDFVMRTVANFTGLEEDGFQRSTLQQITNCNAAKGMGSSCNASSSGGGYPVTKYKPMWASTRTLIYAMFAQECRIWRDEFGISYPDCFGMT